MKTNSWKIRISYEIFMLFFTLLLAAVFIFDCADIYYADYAFEYIQQKFVILIIPFAIYVLCIVVGELISRLIPARREYSPQPQKHFSGISLGFIAEIILKSICALICLGVSIFCIVKFATFSLTDESANVQVLNLLKSLAPWIILCFVLWLVVAIFKFPNHKLKTRFWDSEKFIFFVRIFILGLAIVLLVLGIINGGQNEVLAKAIKICRECIGIG